MPSATQLPLPAAYGRPKKLLGWGIVDERLRTSPRYWLATVRADGRPHAVPLDGIWVDDALYFGGSPETVHHRNLERKPEANVHLEDGAAAVIVDGTVEWLLANTALARRLADASKAKYGYAGSLDSYMYGLWTLRPRTVLAWTQLHVDATRYTFASAGA